MTARAWPRPTAGRERLTPDQEDSLDALVAHFGDGRISVQASGVAEIVHTEYPGDPAWLVNPEGDVAESAATPTYRYSREEVQRWSSSS